MSHLGAAERVQGVLSVVLRTPFEQVAFPTNFPAVLQVLLSILVQVPRFVSQVGAAVLYQLDHGSSLLGSSSLLLTQPLLPMAFIQMLYVCPFIKVYE